MNEMTVTKSMLCTALRDLGIVPGDAVVVHSSLKSFGQVDGGPAAIAETVTEVVGTDGLVTMPVYAQSEDEHGDLLRVPEPAARVSTGIIPATFGRLPGVRLATHPLYAFGFFGRDAEELQRKTERLLLPYGPDQPLNCLYPRRGKIVQLGVDDVTNTSIHVAEELADPDYLAAKKSVSATTVDAFFALPVEARREIMEKHRTGPRRDFRKCTPLIEAAGLRNAVLVGSARVAATDFVGMIDLLSEEIRRNPELMIRS
ncbi:MAG: AAC(3) family N-acetyltransferase [Armatimonadota bacterium]